MRVDMRVSGDKTIEKWMKRTLKQNPQSMLRDIGRAGEDALKSSTPVRTGKTAAGWTYKIIKQSGGWEVSWYNYSHPETSANVALLLQYGHGTGTGGYVRGRDYINPAMRGVFGRGTKEIEREMIK